MSGEKTGQSSDEQPESGIGRRDALKALAAAASGATVGVASASPAVAAGAAEAGAVSNRC